MLSKCQNVGPGFTSHLRKEIQGSRNVPSDHPGGKMRKIFLAPLVDSLWIPLQKGGFAWLHMQDSLAKKWSRLITYAGFPLEKVRSSIRIRVFLHTNNCLPPYVMSSCRIYYVIKIKAGSFWTRNRSCNRFAIGVHFFGKCCSLFITMAFVTIAFLFVVFSPPTPTPHFIAFPPPPPPHFLLSFPPPPHFHLLISIVFPPPSHFYCFHSSTIFTVFRPPLPPHFYCFPFSSSFFCFLLLLLHLHLHISIVFFPPPHHFYCFPSTTTFLLFHFSTIFTVSLLLPIFFIVFSSSSSSILLFFLPPPPSPHFHCFPSASFSFLLSSFHHHYHISIVFTPPHFYCFLSSSYSFLFFSSTTVNKRLQTAIISLFCSNVSWFSSAVSWLPVYQRQFPLKTATPQQIHALVQVLYNILMGHISIPEENKRMLLSYKDALLDLARRNVP